MVVEVVVVGGERGEGGVLMLLGLCGVFWTLIGFGVLVGSAGVAGRQSGSQASQHPRQLNPSPQPITHLHRPMARNPRPLRPLPRHWVRAAAGAARQAGAALDSAAGAGG